MASVSAGFPMCSTLAALQQARAIAMRSTSRGSCDTSTIVMPICWNSRSLCMALPLERLVADRERLVYQDDFGIEVDRDGDAQPHVHARRVVPHGHVDEALEFREPDDRVEARVDGPAPARPCSDALR